VKLLTRYAFSLIGTHYSWGGSNPIGGFDCSGFVLELLSAAGIAPPIDMTANSLYSYLKSEGLYSTGNACESALAFYGKEKNKITHVGYCISNTHMIEAGGGHSETRSKEDANLANAFVRLRPILRRNDLIDILNPAVQIC
jgi:cell wall-associated NlpC family hydrolase